MFVVSRLSTSSIIYIFYPKSSLIVYYLSCHNTLFQINYFGVLKLVQHYLRAVKVN